MKPYWEPVFENDEFIVEYDPVTQTYRVSYFDNCHYVTECQFPAAETTDTL
ncbi:MAG: hypothetical protein IJO50_03255 [Clostridia bacterium]|nr:hypothetical protein [Clostridia bacterium]